MQPNNDSLPTDVNNSASPINYTTRKLQQQDETTPADTYTNNLCITLSTQWCEKYLNHTVLEHLLLLPQHARWVVQQIVSVRRAALGHICA